MDDLYLTLRTKAISSHGFPNVQLPWNPENFEATNEGYQKALRRMEDLWGDALNRRLTLYLCKPDDDNITIEDWNKDGYDEEE